MPKKRDWRTAKRQRNSGLTIRLSDAERATINDMAANVNTTPGAMVRTITLMVANTPSLESLREPHSLPTPSLKPELAKLLAELGKIGSNLNQIAKLFHSGGTLPAEDVREELNALKAVRLRLRQALAKA